MPLIPQQQPPYYNSQNQYTAKYIARLEQAGTAAPVPTEFLNNTPGTITWTRTGTGTYEATFSNAPTLTNNNTAIMISACAGLAQGSYTAANKILIETYTPDYTPSDDIIANTLIEITIYP